MIAVAVLLPHVVGQAVAGGAWPVATSVATVTTTTSVLALGAGCVLCCHWWLSHNQDAAWAGAILVAVGIALLPVRVASLDSDTPPAAGSPAVVDDLSVLVLMLLLPLAMRHRAFARRIDPLALGAAVGLTYAALNLASVADHLEGLAGLPGRPAWVGELGALAIGAAVLRLVDRLRSLPQWARRDLHLATVLLTLAWVLRQGTVGDVGLGDAVAAGLALVGTVVITTTATALLLRALRDHERRMRLLADRAEVAEHLVRMDQEILHEVRGTVAGIRSASEVLDRLRAEGSTAHHERLQHLVGLEVERLQRLLDQRSDPPEVVELDDILVNLVSSYRYLGLSVAWRPGGMRAWARPTDVAEILHILLSNAARHAPGSTVTLDTRGAGDLTEICVADDGPGIPPGLRETVFDRGVRRPTSRGQGLGLHIARRLTAEQGGDLSLAPSVGGTTFVLRLPAIMEAAS